MLYAIKTSPQLTTWQDMLAVWQAADQIDIFQSAWTFDHFYPILVPDTSGPCMDGWITMTALAQATKRIRIGCLVTGVVYRHPAVLANMAATLDIISNGRLELGLGAGWNLEECGAYGIKLGSMKERMDRFDEACEVIHLLLTQEISNFSGKYFTLTNARNNPPPIQRPHPPICIGGNGEKRTFPNVARWAQHWNYAPRDVEGFIAKREALHRVCREQGRNPQDLLTSAHVYVDPADLPALEAHLTKFREAGLGMAILYLPPPHRPDILEPLAKIAERVG